MLRELLTLLVMPVPMVLALLALSVWRRSWRLAAAAVVLLWLASAPIVSGQLVRVAEGWRDRPPIDAIARCDAALVLSGGFRDVPGASGATEFDDCDRALAGYDLYHAGKAPRIILVTSAFHMTRAESLFRAAGLDVTPFPVDFRGPTRITLRSFIPSGTALAQTDLALHEIYGRLYYWLRGLVVGFSI